jgi:hypothetical protein
MRRKYLRRKYPGAIVDVGVVVDDTFGTALCDHH